MALLIEKQGHTWPQSLAIDKLEWNRGNAPCGMALSVYAGEEVPAQELRNRLSLEVPD